MPRLQLQLLFLLRHIVRQHAACGRAFFGTGFHLLHLFFYDWLLDVPMSVALHLALLFFGRRFDEVEDFLGHSSTDLGWVKLVVFLFESFGSKDVSYFLVDYDLALSGCLVVLIHNTQLGYIQQSFRTHKLPHLIFLQLNGLHRLLKVLPLLLPPVFVHSESLSHVLCRIERNPLAEQSSK